MTITIEAVRGNRVQDLIGELSALRLSVFREWPYLYDGDTAYEENYLATFAEAAGAVIVCAFDGSRMVGAATAAPVSGHTNEFVPLLEAKGYDANEIFYCGESLLLPAYRGRGIGHAFFDLREAHAHSLNASGSRFRYAAFCGVIRDDNDPRAPHDYRKLDGFWRKRGYEKINGLVGKYDWREIGSDRETSHDMQFWVRALGDASA